MRATNTDALCPRRIDRARLGLRREASDSRRCPEPTRIRYGTVTQHLVVREVRNGLIIGERRGRATEVYSVSFLRQLTRLPVTIDTAPDEETVMLLARQHRLTVYDAAYLELALREAVPLATLDKALADAARAEGVPLIGSS